MLGAGAKSTGGKSSHDLADYEAPAHADMPHQEGIFIEEVDPARSPLKAKGVGKLEMSGVSAAIANAVQNATDVRIRNYPLTLAKFLRALPDVARNKTPGFRRVD